ncbi:MAG: glycosyltransferase, partial [Chloroflexota bacterium]|nr:glycosyltransferase [Chloroflexota bacterium]
LAELGCEVSVITSKEGQGTASVSYPLSIFPVIERWGWSSWRRIINLLGQLQPDVVNIQYQAAAYRMHPAINFLPLRLRVGTAARPYIVTTFHDLKVPYLFPKAGPIRWWVNLALARSSDAVIVTNKEDSIKLKPYNLSTPCLIPIGSNIAPRLPFGYDRDAWRARWGVGPNDLLLSYFGFLNESKGGETLVRALDRLVRGGYNARLLMVGGKVGSSDPTNVAYLRRVERLIEELGLVDRMLWTGYTPQDEVSANLLASDICVLPYRDGASFRRGSFIAALAHGLPIVSTRPQVDLAELRNGENILLVPPDAPTALAGAIARLAEDPKLRRRLGEGAARLAQNFSWEGIAKKTLALYDRIVNG